MLLRVIAWTLAATFPTTGELPGLDRLPAAGTLQKILSTAPHGFKIGLYAAVLLFLISPLLTVWWPLPAFLLPRTTLDRHADRMAGHRFYIVRQAMLLLKTVGGLVWGMHPEVRQALDIKLVPEDPGTWQRGESRLGTPP